ncbi:hypothetical protein Tco_1180522, partial [Tanacetum coccineum]
DVVFDAFEFINPFATLVTEVGESSSHRIDLKNIISLTESVSGNLLKWLWKNKKDEESTIIRNKVYMDSLSKIQRRDTKISNQLSKDDTTRNPDPTTPSTQVHAEKDNNIQADDVVFDAFEFINPFATRVTELATNPEMRFCALIVSETEPKNIKEAMTDHAWIEAIEEEHHQFDRFGVWEIVKVKLQLINIPNDPYSDATQFGGVTDWYQSQAVMSADSAVTYTSVHSEARSWSIPSEDPYEEAARQLLEQAPRSPEYVPDPIGLEDHVPMYIPKPEHPKDLVPAEDEAPTTPLPPSFLSPRIRPLRTRAPMAQMRATTPSAYHSLLLSGTPPLLPIPLPAPSTSRRDDIPEADAPP